MTMGERVEHRLCPENPKILGEVAFGIGENTLNANSKAVATQILRYLHIYIYNTYRP